MFARDSIIVWHFKSFRRKRRRMRGWAVNPSGPNVRRLARPKELDAWIKTLQPIATPRAPHDEPPCG